MVSFYASGYHYGQVAALVAQSGRPLWTHVLSSYTGVGVAPTQIFVVDTDSHGVGRSTCVRAHRIGNKKR